MIEIVVECNPDEALLKVLGYSNKMIIHQPSRGQVVNYLERNPTAIGIVDDDPGSAKPNYFKKFKKETDEKFGVESYAIDKLGTRLIIIKPRLEEWIIKHAQESKIDLTKHSMPSSGNELHKIINTRIPRFMNLLKEMIEKGSPSLRHLKSLIDQNK